MIRTSTVLYAVVALGLPSLASSEIVIDGRYDPDEDYAIGYEVSLNVEGVSDPVEEKGELWYHYDKDPVSGKYLLSVVFVQPLTLVDNSYGANSIGWGEDAPSGKNHNFKDLKGSDKARFTITDSSGEVVFDFTLDYISEIVQDEGEDKNKGKGKGKDKGKGKGKDKDKGKGKDKGKDKGSGAYGSLGVTGGEGEVHTGDPDHLLDWATSLDYNFNSLGYVLTEDSPASDEDYAENPEFPGWVFEVIYEFKVDGDLFGNNSLGGITIPIVHDSPNKIGKNKVYPDIDPEDDDPEPE